MGVFQSTRPCRARPPKGLAAAVSTGFNPRARAGRDDCQRHAPYHLLCFNPRARAGRDHREIAEVILCKPVSIHAPVQGATPMTQLRQRVVRVSIHAPVQGATNAVVLRRKTAGVSIHAPVQGATRSCRRPWSIRSVSIHAPVQGATRESNAMKKWVKSTHFR